VLRTIVVYLMSSNMREVHFIPFIYVKKGNGIIKCYGLGFILLQ